MTTSCCARCIGDVHRNVRMRGVGAQELVYALLCVPRIETVLGGQPVEVVFALAMSEEVSQLFEILQRLVRDHH
eukprot:958483-Prorocentrum_minimum.AAC.1